MPKNPGRQCRSAIPVRPRSAGADRGQDRADCSRGANTTGRHRLPGSRGVRLPAIRGRAGAQAPGTGPELGPVGIFCLHSLFDFTPVAGTRRREGAVPFLLALPECRVGLVDVFDQL